MVNETPSLRPLRGNAARAHLRAAVTLGAILLIALIVPQTARAQRGGGGFGGFHGGVGGGGWQGGSSGGWRGGDSGGGGSSSGGGWQGGGSGGDWHGGNGGGSSGWNGGGGGSWHGGSWHQGWYGSRYGWWWVVPGFGWYAYDEPIYPYPDPYAYTQAVAAPPYWYYCSNPAGYYPYVTQCYGPWQPAPAQPPAPGYTPQPGYAPQAGGSRNSTANDLNRQELNRAQVAPVNPPLPPYYPPPPAN
jgi:hypothetical protein